MTIRKDLYRFVEGTQVWTVTSADEDESYNGEVYESITIDKGEVKSKSEVSKENLDIKVSTQNEFGRRWLVNVIDTPITLTIFERDDVETNTIWKGRFVTIQPKGTDLIMSFESVYTSVKRPGLRERMQKTCRFVLYGRGCNLLADDFAVVGEATNVDGVLITIAEAALEADGWYSGGMLQAPDGSFSYIIDHVGSLLTLQRPNDSLVYDFANLGYGYNYGGVIGGVLNISIYRGCDRSRVICRDKFDNLLNHGGFTWQPSRNPLDGSSIV